MKLLFSDSNTDMEAIWMYPHPFCKLSNLGYMKYMENVFWFLIHFVSFRPVLNVVVIILNGLVLLMESGYA